MITLCLHMKTPSLKLNFIWQELSVSNLLKYSLKVQVVDECEKNPFSVQYYVVIVLLLVFELNSYNINYKFIPCLWT